MMREIKFRFWDLINQQMVFDICLCDVYDEDLEEDRYIPMQYTGLKDKNGKEIYEGDIIEYACDKDENTRRKRQVVGFEYGCFTLKEDENWALMFGLHDHLDCDGNWSDEHFEVIGNIYENKELLNK
jgi:uncharacterized phage protein (TIGR01671 family)